MTTTPHSLTELKDALEFDSYFEWPFLIIEESIKVALVADKYTIHFEDGSWAWTDPKGIVKFIETCLVEVASE